MNFLDEKYWEQRFFDLWSIVHFNSGVMFAFLALELSVGFWLAFGVLLILTILWEVYEIMAKVEEAKENRVTDILIALIGLILVYAVMSDFTESRTLYYTILAVYAFCSILLMCIGWLAYKKYSKI